MLEYLVIRQKELLATLLCELSIEFLEKILKKFLDEFMREFQLQSKKVSEESIGKISEREITKEIPRGVYEGTRIPQEISKRVSAET